MARPVGNANSPMAIIGPDARALLRSTEALAPLVFVEATLRHLVTCRLEHERGVMALDDLCNDLKLPIDYVPLRQCIPLTRTPASIVFLQNNTVPLRALRGELSWISSEPTILRLDAEKEVGFVRSVYHLRCDAQSDAVSLRCDRWAAAATPGAPYVHTCRFVRARNVVVTGYDIKPVFGIDFPGSPTA